MSQHDFIIDNQFFPQTRADINAALQAIATNSSGATEPAIPTTDPVTDRGHQWWYDTTNYQLKIRNTAGTGWTVIATLDAAGANVVSITTQGLTLGSTALTTTGTEINQLAAITRGSILYGNASGDTARLAAGGASTVLTSDGTDIAWAAAGGAGVPTVTVIYHAANTPPTDFIKANGAAVSRTTYSDLFTAIGTTFGVGDGSTTFNVPDLRGEFMRGWDDSRGIDSSRSFGSAQSDELKSHSHSIPMWRDNFHGTRPLGGSSTNLTASSTSAFGGTETRPRNIALLACIKY